MKYLILIITIFVISCSDSERTDGGVSEDCSFYEGLNLSKYPEGDALESKNMGDARFLAFHSGSGMSVPGMEEAARDIEILTEQNFRILFRLSDSGGTPFCLSGYEKAEEYMRRYNLEIERLMSAGSAAKARTPGLR